jgi:hypothetical protein
MSREPEAKPERPPVTPDPAVARDPTRQSGASAQLNVLLIALLLFYSTPVFIAAGNALWSIGSPPKAVFDESKFITYLLTTLAKEKQYLGVFHQLLVPVLAAFTAFGFDQLRESRGASWIFVLPLLVLFLAIIMAASFSFLTNIGDPSTVSNMFNTMAQNLSIYVLTLFGLEGASQRRRKPGE